MKRRVSLLAFALACAAASAGEPLGTSTLTTLASAGGVTAKSEAGTLPYLMLSALSSSTGELLPWA